MSYHFTNLGQSPQDPYDLSVCWPQYRAEADQIVAGIRADIARVAAAHPANAQVLDDELKALLQKFRDVNGCPNLSEGEKGNHKYTAELQYLIDKAKAAVEAATFASQEKQQLEIQHSQSGETTTIIIAVAVAILLMAVIGAVMLLVKKGGEPQFADLVDEDQAQ